MGAANMQKAAAAVETLFPGRAAEGCLGRDDGAGVGLDGERGLQPEQGDQPVNVTRGPTQDQVTAQEPGGVLGDQQGLHAGAVHEGHPRQVQVQ